jgi:outer membrane beta-barrel protein
MNAKNEERKHKMSYRRIINDLTVTVILSCWSLISLASEDSLYDFLWLDKDKSVYVLQNKQFKKKGRVFTELGYLKGMSSNYLNVNGGALSMSYCFSEEWAGEISYLHYSNENNTDYKNVREINDTEPFVRELVSSTSAMTKWAPFYGKINTFNQIIYFDLILGIGVSSLKSRANLGVSDTNPNAKKESENQIGGVSKLELKVYISEYWNFGTYLQSLYYKSEAPRIINKDELKINNDFVIYTGFSF